MTERSEALLQQKRDDLKGTERILRDLDSLGYHIHSIDSTIVHQTKDKILRRYQVALDFTNDKPMNDRIIFRGEWA